MRDKAAGPDGSALSEGLDNEGTAYCFLVELFARGGNSQGWYHTGFTDVNHQSRMTKSPHEARRYPREGAEMVAYDLNTHMMTNEWRAVEHGFAV